MSQEGQLLDKKSLRAVSSQTVDWAELAKDYAAFANATGGHLLIGIEDGQDQPPAGQRIPAELPDMLRHKLAERMANVAALPNIVIADNGCQYIDLTIPRTPAVASTTDDRYFLRVADHSEIHQRIGAEVPRSRIRRNLEQLVKEGTLHQEGVRSGTRYRQP
jgi:ATP-dependent DNA helicase RecG